MRPAESALVGERGGAGSAGQSWRAIRFSVSRRIGLAVVLSASLALVAGALGISFALQSEDQAHMALTSLLPATATANEILAVLIDQETGERGYEITAQARFLQPFTNGKAETPRLLGTLHGELAADPRGRGLLATVGARYRTWLTTFADPEIAAVAAGDGAAAIATERTGIGKSLFDALRRSVTTLDGHLATEVQAATSRSLGLQEDTLWIVVAILACLVAGAVLGLVVLTRWVIHPVRELEHEVRVVAAGDIDHEVGSSGPSEIARLGQSVEQMRRRVHEQSTEIREQRTIAESLQRALLPKSLPVPDGFRAAARYVPGTADIEVGGDWFNLRVAGPGRSFFAVGDVCGRGLRAATLMASLRFGINAYAAERPDPAEVLARLGRLIPASTDGAFATVLCGLVDAEAGRLTVASAGHLAPLLVPAGGPAEPVAVAPGPPIGLGRDRYRAAVVPVPERARLLAFTDGVVERRSEPITEGIERLALTASADLALEELLDDILRTLVPDSSHDDVVLLGLEWSPDPGAPTT